MKEVKEKLNAYDFNVIYIKSLSHLFKIKDHGCMQHAINEHPEKFHKIGDDTLMYDDI